ncbi:MAG: COX15/CtaA family protein [Oligoflexia bacterium]|nr:COX15/CtaA family protein [Oligoflexia bacterium]
MEHTSAAISEPLSLSIEPPKASLRFFTKLLTCLVLFLIFMGALVTSNDAGLAVPDWPTSYGENMFLFPPSRWIGGIFYEHVHRLIASGIGFLTLVMSVWIWIVEKRSWVKKLAAAALVAVILQGLLGGLTVLYKLPDAVSVAHGMLGQLFFCIAIMIAYSQSQELHDRVMADYPSGDARLFRLAKFSFFIVLSQLLVGAVMRHSGSGLAVPDFPRIAGEWWPSFNAATLEVINGMRRELRLTAVDMHQVYLHIAHRVWGVVTALSVLMLGIWLSAGDGEAGKLRSTARFMALLVLIQFGFGALTVLTHRHPHMTSVHVMAGALLLGTTVLAMLRAYPVKPKTE